MAAPLDYSKCKTLEDCFEVRLQHCMSHNVYENDRDKMLAEYATGCAVVKELGVWQGGTFAMFLALDGVEEVVGVDISYNKYRQSMQKLVDDYAESSGKTVTLLEMSSTDTASVTPCDFLHIDSLHDPVYLMNELMLHASSVSKRIAFHDVNQKGRELFMVVTQFIEKVQPNTWKVVADLPLGKCGCTVIERIA